MARGDVVSDIQSIASGASLDYQPGAGEEAMITEIGSSAVINTSPDGVPNVNVGLYDGSIFSHLLTPAGARKWGKRLQLYVNNTNYLRITNADGATKILSFSGVMTK